MPRAFEIGRTILLWIVTIFAALFAATLFVTFLHQTFGS